MSAKTKIAAREEQSSKEPKEKRNIFSEFLEEHKESHFNFHDQVYYLIGTGSLKLDKALGGGFFPGIVNFSGSSEGGKTSCAVDTLNHFLATIPNSKGLYVKCEGRFSKAMREKSQHPFVDSPKDWEVGTTLILKSHVYETVAAFVDLAINNNPDGYRYFIIIDSLDGLNLRGDLDKSFDGDESVKVAGAPLLTKRILKQCSLPITENGHFMILISQVSASIAGKYDVPDQLKGTGGGGNAKVHFCDFNLEFRPRNAEDLILKDNDKRLEKDIEGSNMVGHYCKVTIRKSANEKTNLVARYPIKYGVKKGSSVWAEYEVYDLLSVFNLIEKKGSWISGNEKLKKILEDAKVSPALIANDKHQGRNNFLNWIAEPEVLKATKEYLRDLLGEEF